MMTGQKTHPPGTIINTLIFRQLVWYLLIGLSGLCVDALIFYALRTFSPLSLIWSNVSARHAGALYTFSLNKMFTFQARSSTRAESYFQFGQYILLLYCSIALSTLFLSIFIQGFAVSGPAVETLWKFSIDFGCAILNFLVCKYGIFKR